MQPTPSPRSIARPQAFFLTTPFAFLATVTDQTPAGTLRLCSRRWQRRSTCGRWRLWDASAYQVVLPDASSFRRSPLPACLPSSYARRSWRNAGRIPQLERAHLPVEAGLHGAIDFNHGVGDLGNAIRGIGPQLRDHGPEKQVGLVFRERWSGTGPDRRSASPFRGQGTSVSCCSRYSSVFHRARSASRHAACFL